MQTLLAEYLRVQKMTHAEFADKAEVPEPQISLWSRGVRCPDIANAIKIANATADAEGVPFVPVEHWADVKKQKASKKKRSKKVA